MRRIIITMGWLASLGLLLAACGTAAPVAPTVTVAPVQAGPQPGDKAPDFTLADNEGNSVQLSAVIADHKSTVLVFYLSHT